MKRIFKAVKLGPYTNFNISVSIIYILYLCKLIMSACPDLHVFCDAYKDDIILLS